MSSPIHWSPSRTSLRFISYFSSQQCSTFMIAFGRKDYNLEWLPPTWGWLIGLTCLDLRCSLIEHTHGSYSQKLRSGYLDGSWDWVNWIKRISTLWFIWDLFFICWVRHVFFTSSCFKNSIYAWVRARFSLNLSRDHLRHTVNGSLSDQSPISS